MLSTVRRSAYNVLCIPRTRSDAMRTFHASCWRANAVRNSQKAAKPENEQARKNTDEKPVSGEVHPLNRPLGVRERPTTVVQTRTEKMKELLDDQKRMEQRRHLIKEATKGYFHDMNMTRRNGGKTWIAPNVLIREDKSLYFPNVKGQCLADNMTKDTTPMCFGKISLVAMIGSQISQVHTESFAGPTYSRFHSTPLFQYVQINLQENILKSFLVRMFSNTLRSSVPKELQPTYLVSRQNMEYVRDSLGMTNSKVGYVYLVDENLRIRWAGCADAYPAESAALENCTGVLLKRLEGKMKLAKKAVPPATLTL